MATGDNNFIVAIELGSSKVTAIAGRKDPDGAIQVLAFAQEPSTTFIRKGRINNISKMTTCLSSMKEKLEQKLQKHISQVYVGIGGMGMHTVANSVVRHFESKVEITQEMIDSMNDENRNSSNADRDILESIPQEFRLGTQLTIEPVGIQSDHIEGNFLNIVASSSIREDIRNCFKAAEVKIAELPITVQALSDTMLTEPERRSGCVFVDMGSETTSVAIYKNNLLRHLAVIPLGGANINRDIMSLQIEDDEAEELKLKYGSAVSAPEDEEHKPIILRDGRTIPYEEFSGLVEARTEEIILNVKNQISLTKFDVNQLIGGIIVTGGASHMKNIDKAFTALTGFEKLRFVRKINVALRCPDYPSLNNDGDCNAALALIDKGNINCCGGDLGGPTDLFGPTQEEEEEMERAKAAAEEERKRQEEEDAEKLRLQEEAEAEAKRKQEEKDKRDKEKEERKKKIFGTFKKVGNWFGNLVKEDEGNN